MKGSPRDSMKLLIPFFSFCESGSYSRDCFFRIKGHHLCLSISKDTIIQFITAHRWDTPVHSITTVPETKSYLRTRTIPTKTPDKDTSPASNSLLISQAKQTKPGLPFALRSSIAEELLLDFIRQGMPFPVVRLPVHVVVPLIIHFGSTRDSCWPCSNIFQLRRELLSLFLELT